MVPLHDLAVGADDGGAEVVGDESAFGLDGEREEVGDLGEVGGLRRSEFPFVEQSRRMRVRHGKSVVAQDLGSVMLRVEADAQQASARERGIVAELLVDLGEVAAHARAEIGEWAARIDKGDEQNFPAILPYRNALAALIGEREVGDIFSGGGHVQSVRGCGGRNCRVTGDFDVLEPGVGAGVVIVGLGEDQNGGNGIAGLELREDALGPDFIDHRHGVHDAGNQIVLDGGRLVLNVDADHPAGHRIALDRLRRGLLTGE